MKIPVRFQLTDISEGKLDKAISVIIPMNRGLKQAPIIKSLGDWLKELKGDKNES